MEYYQGKSIFEGIAIGPVRIFSKNVKQIRRQHVSDSGAEIKRFHLACKEASAQLERLYKKALSEAGESSAMIFEIHMMLLEDDDYLNSVYNIIRTQKVNAEFAVANTGDNFSHLFSSMEDEYMKSRAADIKDISDRLIRILVGDISDSQINTPTIIMAEDLTPSETVQLDKTKLLAFITRSSSTNSHTAILARTMGIPALAGVEIQRDWNGKLAIVDGHTGTLIIDPSQKKLEEMTRKQQEDAAQKKLLSELKGKDTVTLDGKRINLYANIGNVRDVAQALSNDAGGIGLFRSEFLYLESSDFPSEEMQLRSYRAVAESMAGRKVIIRTLDIGADKQTDYLQLEKEVNPAMGFRAIRFCLKNPELFKVQLRAILRASIYGNISLMFPMINSVEELTQIKKIFEEVKTELYSQCIPFADIEIGIMIETPAAAIISDLLAREVDFFSIGTNDLTQYSLAIDRQNPRLDSFYDPHHEGILRMIDMVIKNGHKENCWVGICGELGSDMSLTKRFLQMGIDELSVSPSYILPLRKYIREISLSIH